MAPLVDRMVQDDPAKRPTIDEVAHTFDGIVKGLSTAKLRSRLISRDEANEDVLINIISHWYRRLKYTLQGHPAVPSR
jgi:hypothetical protein